MYKLLKDEEKIEIEKINSRLHGPEYLSSDLKSILEELNFLLKIENAIIFVQNGNVKRQEFLGNAEEYWIKYSNVIKEYTSKSMNLKKYFLVRDLNHDIRNLLVLPIKDNDNSIGAFIIINQLLENDQHNAEIIKILESQAKFALKKAKEREKVLQLFGQYVDKRQIVKLLENPDFLKKPEMTDSVVLFADLSGFTKLLNEKNINEVFEFLNKTLYEYTKIINTNNGIVDKFVGDQIIGIFGIVDQQNKVDNAILSAIKLKKVLKKEFSKYNIGVKISLVKGQMLYGNIGGLYKADITVIGPAVNLASRLCSFADREEILVNKEIYNLLNKKYTFKLKTMKKFKGFSKAEIIYKLV